MRPVLPSHEYIFVPIHYTSALENKTSTKMLITQSGMSTKKQAWLQIDLTNQQHLQRKGCGLPCVSWERGVVWDKKCMEAKALQTIDTLYITRYNYNNIAGTYCTDKIELYGWRKLLVYSIRQTGNFCPDLSNVF